MSRAGRRWDVPGVTADLDHAARMRAEADGVSIAEYVRRAVAAALAVPAPASNKPTPPAEVPDGVSKISSAVPGPLTLACVSTLAHPKAPSTTSGRALVDDIASRSGTTAEVVRRAALRAGLIVLNTRPELVSQLEATSSGRGAPTVGPETRR